MFIIYKACVKRNQALMASNSCYDLHLFALGTVTPDIALSDFKNVISYQGFEYSQGKTRDYSSSGYYFDHVDYCYYY
jgi:hypothetical protein